MVIADGVLTPAQSVLGAIQGLSVIKPDIQTSTIVGTTCGILVLLFLIQPLGTTKLASCFAPVVILWLGFNGCFGIYNLVKYDWTVLKAFSPSFAIRFFVDHKTEGWRMLGGVLLAFTGVEALFADLGAFTMRAVQMSWLMWTYPCLLLGYSGQRTSCAYLRHAGKVLQSLFQHRPSRHALPELGSGRLGSHCCLASHHHGHFPGNHSLALSL